MAITDEERYKATIDTLSDFLPRFSEALEMMAAAYIKATDIPIEECEMVIEQTMEPVGWIYYFRRRNHEE